MGGAWIVNQLGYFFRDEASLFLGSEFMSNWIAKLAGAHYTLMTQYAGVAFVSIVTPHTSCRRIGCLRMICLH